MKVFKHTNQSKKLILVIVCIMLFSFCCPKPVQAFELEHIVMAPCHLLYWLPKGLLDFFNDIFCDDTHQNKNTIYLSPETIIKGKFLLLNPNIFDDGSGKTYFDEGNMQNGTSISQGRTQLRETISGWYYALRNLAIIALLSVLVYIGIRMLLTSISQDKAKYKMMLKDWLVALILLFAMHYIMIGILKISDEITEAIGATGTSINMTEKTITKVEDILFNDNGEWSDHDYRDGKGYDIGDAYAQTIVFLAIITYTGLFLFKYLMRAIRVIFLILLAPISCITYPIDKISDGKAQAYNRWFQEFLYTIIIQPFHLLIYIVLVGSASTLADTNVIYALMCFAVMIPAEKFIKEMFGFKDKLGSPLGAFAAGAIGNQLRHMLKGGDSKEKKQEGADNDSTPNKLPPRTTDDKSELVDGNTGSRGSSNQGDESNSEINNENNSQEEVSDVALDEGDNSQQEGSDTALDGGIDSQEEGVDLALDGEKEDPAGRSNSEQGQENENNDVSWKDRAKAYGKGKFNKASSIHNQRVSKKYGTTRRWKRNLKRAGRGAKVLAKASLKGAAIATAATAATTVALATGNLKEAGGILAGVGTYVGHKAYKGGKRAIKGVKGVAKDYNQGLSGDARRERQAFNEFEGNVTQQNNAVNGFRKKHGRDPNRKELENEIRDRFTLSRWGLKDEQIDDALPMYQEKRDQLLKDGISKERAEEIAAAQTKSSADLAKWHKPADFEDPKKVENMYNTMKNNLKEKTGCDDATADKYAKQYIKNAAKMHSINNPPLPTRNETVDIPVQRRLPDSLRNSLGIHESNMNPEREERISTLTMRLKDEGFDQAQINELAESAANSRMNADGVIKNYDNIVEAAIEYKKNSSNDADIEKLVRGQNAGGDPTRVQIDAEKNERFVLRTTLNMKDEKDVTAARQLEESTFKTKTDKQIAREYAKANMHAIKNGSDMTVAKKQLETTLKEKGNLSQDKAKDEADKIHDFVTGVYNKPTKNKK